MKTKGLLETIPEYAGNIIKRFCSLVTSLTQCLWKGHDLEEISGEKWTWQSYRKCKRCGLNVDINYKDRETNG